MINWLQQFFHKVTSVFRGEHLDHDLEAELAAHLEKTCSAACPLRKPGVRH
jgi:hypothetical protein